MRSLIVGSGVAVFLGVAAGFAFRFDRAPAPPTAVAATVDAAPTTLAADGSATAEAPPPPLTEAAAPSPTLADQVNQAADEHLYRSVYRPERIEDARPTPGDEPAPWDARRDASQPREDLEVASAGPYRGAPADLAPRDPAGEDDAAPPPPPRDDDER